MNIAALIVALVAQDEVPMRAAPDPGAPRQAVLWQGDWLEVRGRRRDYFQVYDHRRERPGYVHVSRVRSYGPGVKAARRLRAVIDFLRDAPGAEAQGIGHVALYLRLAPAGEAGAEIFDALGTMADRLARRASARASSRRRHVSAHLDVAASYGVPFVSFQQGERTRICYRGDAFRRVLALQADADAKARAALALTRVSCFKPGLRPDERRALLSWSLSVLDRADPTSAVPYVGNRLRLRRARLASDLAYELARGGKLAEAGALSQQGLSTFARVDRAQLAPGDETPHARVALRLAALRWAREPASAKRSDHGPRLKLVARQPGETCVQLLEGPAKRGQPPLISRCTFGLVWPSSVNVSPRRRQLTVAVQQMAGWLEVWIFQRSTSGWSVTPLVPAAVEPGLGYVEVAGWTPGGRRLLLVREVAANGRVRRRFQALDARTLRVLVDASSLQRFVTFRRWHSASWKRATLALR